MKCFLLLLAFELVSSDKLDRTYLPPPGAKYSGGTLDDLHPPLAYPHENKPGSVQNGIISNDMPGDSGHYLNQDVKNIFPSVPLDYTSSPKYDGILKPMTSHPNYFRHTSSQPRVGLKNYNNFPSTFPSTNYLPSKPQFGTESYNTPYTPIFTTTSPKNVVTPGNSKFNPRYDENYNGNYYFVPATQSNIGKAIPRPDNNIPGNIAKIQYPNQNSKALNDISQNYQPSAFGFYGGSPMIMTSQNQVPQNLNNNDVKLNLNYGDIIKEVPQTPTTVKPYQKPLVGATSIAESDTNNSNPPLSTVVPSLQNQQTQFQLPTATIRSFPKGDASYRSGQRNKMLSRPRYRSQRPQDKSDRNAVVVNYDKNVSPEGYSYSYDTSNGIHANETATTTNGVKSKGFYSYTGDDGRVYTVTYTADENGFRPQGDHLPTLPPVPEAIKKVIEQAERDKAAGIIDDGSYDERKYGYMNYESGINKYLPIKKSERKALKINNNRKPINRISITDKSLSDVSAISNRNKFVESSYDANKDTKMEEIPSINTRNRSRLEPNGQIRGLNKFLNRQPITSKDDDQFTVRKSSDGQNMSLPNTINQNKVMAKTPTEIQFGQNEKQIPKWPFNDTGYYYVPPPNKFNSNAQNSSTRKSSYVTTVDQIPNDEIEMRSGFDITKQKGKENNEVNSLSQPTINNRDATTTRKPYISGPYIQEYLNNLNSQPDPSIDNVNPNEISSYPDRQPSSQYMPNTTPMTAQKIVTDPPQVDYPQYYQSTTNTALLDQTLPSTVGNRVNVPSGKPGITVSQDFTTTIRPGTFKDGVLEVKQNVKIYGIGKPERKETFSESNFDYDNDDLFSASTPNVGTFITRASSTINPESMQYTGIFQEIPNTNIFNGNEYIEKEAANANNGAIPETYYDTSNGQNSNPKSDIQSQGYLIRIPEIPFPISPFETGVNTPGQILLNTATDNQNSIPNKPIGEDFSGPKQDQNFDPVNGYYY